MDLKNVVPSLNLYNWDWPIITRQLPRSARQAGVRRRHPARRRAAVDPVRRLHHRGRLREGLGARAQRVRRRGRRGRASRCCSTTSTSGRGARVQRAIIDKNVRVPDGDHIGHDLARDSLRYTVSEGGRDGGPEGERHPAHALAKLLTHASAAAPIALCLPRPLLPAAAREPLDRSGAARAVGGAVSRLERAHPRRVLPRQRVRAHPRQRGPHRGDRQQLRAHVVQLRADAGALDRAATIRRSRRGCATADAAQRRRLGQRRRDRAGVRAPDRAAVQRRATRARSWCGACTTSTAASGTRAEGLWLPETGGVARDAGDADRARRALHDPRARADRGGAGARRARTGRRSTATRVDTGPRLPLAAPRRLGPARSRSACSTGRCRARSRSARPPTAPRACWTRSRRRPIARSVTGPRLVLCASDGELWGHHKKFADLTLAFATRVEAAAPRDRGDEPGRLPGAPPADLGGAAGRGARRRGDRLELRRTGSAAGSATAAATWAATERRQPGLARAAAPGAGRRARRGGRVCTRTRRAICSAIRGRRATRYGAVVDDPPPVRDRALAAFALPRWTTGGEKARLTARRLLELQRATLLMYASCGWFFDDIAGLEGALVIRMGAHALDLLAELGGQAADAAGAGRSSRRRRATAASREPAPTSSAAWRAIASRSRTRSRARRWRTWSARRAVNVGWDRGAVAGQGRDAGGGAARSRASQRSATAAHVRSGAVEMMGYNGAGGVGRRDGREGRGRAADPGRPGRGDARGAGHGGASVAAAGACADAKVLALDGRGGARAAARRRNARGRRAPRRPDARVAGRARRDAVRGEAAAGGRAGTISSRFPTRRPSGACSRSACGRFAHRAGRARRCARSRKKSGSPRQVASPARVSRGIWCRRT